MEAEAGCSLAVQLWLECERKPALRLISVIVLAEPR